MMAIKYMLMNFFMVFRFRGLFISGVLLHSGDEEHVVARDGGRVHELHGRVLLSVFCRPEFRPPVAFQFKPAVSLQEKLLATLAMDGPGEFAERLAGRVLLQFVVGVHVGEIAHRVRRVSRDAFRAQEVQIFQRVRVVAQMRVALCHDEAHFRASEVGEHAFRGFPLGVEREGVADVVLFLCEEVREFLAHRAGFLECARVVVVRGGQDGAAN